MTFLSKLKQIVVGSDPEPIPVLGRNEQCWCGSGKKYKHCHLGADDRKRAAVRAGGPRGGSGAF